MLKIINTVRCSYTPFGSQIAILREAFNKDALDACHSLMNAPWGWQYDFRNVCRCINTSYSVNNLVHWLVLTETVRGFVTLTNVGVHLCPSLRKSVAWLSGYIKVSFRVRKLRGVERDYDEQWIDRKTELGRGLFEYAVYVFSCIDVGRSQEMMVDIACNWAGIPRQLTEGRSVVRDVTLTFLYYSNSVHRNVRSNCL
jgi:hypothetical protein